MDPDSYYAAMGGQTGDTARALRRSILAGRRLDESFRHGHPVYAERGVPICLVKAARNHVLLAFWDGRALLDLEPRLSATGGANMASMKLASPAEAATVPIDALVAAAIAHAGGAAR